MDRPPAPPLPLPRPHQSPINESRRKKRRSERKEETRCERRKREASLGLPCGTTGREREALSWFIATNVECLVPKWLRKEQGGAGSVLGTEVGAAAVRGGGRRRFSYLVVTTKVCNKPTFAVGR